ncbi:RNA 2',3'-cyclic phosphodiesterase [Streptomyces goshikiensis]|uniref:RNA 2',3'-cyclic phosphodiesterase n=1 Tax=Streptomyces goshikiensis TaxID=1942 RepID=A0ABZ1RPJ8_9ACTN|nr:MULTISPECIES: RNA 2',3'-cyclic phosphodiesterase [Streptomyces]AKL66660.1 2'-5' RNA ligase [Streptomyces sp. Mg1]EDX26869.1 2',5' RNA ligase [Streptomyces sp. Mg1]OKI25382.1 2'-5' RNA ligase [Streptomyces sp. CB03578]PJN16024.1 RNA 2',3'-cyclic phosphodiesterase [Streptomyces sp. CB02120-2]RPK49884.1 2',5' RNA ligase family [Streptomyces sp. ADI91-18]
MRLFAAVLPPARAVDELREAVRALPADGRLRWTGEAGWHFTLAFMGEVDDRVLPDLRERLRRAAAHTDPFGLRLHGCGHFGDRALWAGAAGELDSLRMLAERADAAARRAGVPMEQHRRYTPHLTLARCREAVDLRPYLEALGPFEGTRWQVGELSLVRSNLPVSGVPGERPRYEVVAAWPLGGGA